MSIFTDDGPIIACSTPMGSSALAVIRLSGFNKIEDLDVFFNNTGPIEPGKLKYCSLVEPSSKKIIDEIVISYFKAPRSFNGENILELSVHGNPFNIDRIIQLFIDHANFRYAEPGEFSYRALKNNKLSLSQVEGLDLFLNAKSHIILDQASSSLGGDLQKSYLDLRHAYLKLKASLELSIDFLDDVGEEAANKNLNFAWSEFLEQITTLFQRCEVNPKSLLSPEVVIVGAPNAGKSTLFNKLLANDRSIVSSQAGTTRDYVSEHIQINNCEFKLIDTAGLRLSSDEIEQTGIQKAVALIQDAFLKILVINPFDHDQNSISAVENIEFDILILSHADSDNSNFSLNNLPKYKSYLWASFLTGPIGPQNSFIKTGPIEPFNSFIKTGPIEPLDPDVLLNFISSKYLELGSGDPILVPRQRGKIKEIMDKSLQFQEVMLSEKDIGILDSELSIVGQCIEDLLGLVQKDEVLSHIFNNFCIGK